MSHFEQRLHSESKFHGKIIDVIHDTVLLENGKEALAFTGRQNCYAPGINSNCKR